MSHLSSKCDCGRTIHLPKDAPLGYVWVCKNCGERWVLSTHGQPTYETRSKRPPVEPKSDYRPSFSGNSGSSGCMIIGIILISTIVGTIYKVVEFFIAY